MHSMTKQCINVESYYSNVTMYCTPNLLCMYPSLLYSMKLYKIIKLKILKILKIFSINLKILFLMFCKIINLNIFELMFLFQHNF